MLIQKKIDQLFKNLYQHAKKSDYLIYMFWRNSWFKNPAIWLAESILVHISHEQDFSQIWDRESNTVK